MWQYLICMTMSVTWRYMDIYSVIIQYIADNLDPASFDLILELQL